MSKIKVKKIIAILTIITILFIAKYVGSSVFSNENTTDEDTYYIISDISKDQKPIDLEYNTEDDDIHVHIWHSGIYSR